jgi:uncharacterized protein (DUF58 family)
VPVTSNRKIAYREIEHWINWLSQSFAEGKWDSHFLGRGFNFQGIVTYRDDPDLVRINWPATLVTDELQVSTFAEERNVRIYLLGNLGPSMAFGSQVAKLDRLALIAGLFSFSAYRTKDYFRFLGYTNEIEFGFPEPRGREYPYQLAQAILDFNWRGKSRGGLLRASTSLPDQRSLVVIVSDLLGPLEGTEQVIKALFDRHEILPIVLWDRRETELPSGFGILPLQDLETGARRSVLLTKRTREALQKNIASQKDEIEQLFRRYGIKPYFLTQIGRTDLEELMRIFMSRREMI